MKQELIDKLKNSEVILELEHQYEKEVKSKLQRSFESLSKLNDLKLQIIERDEPIPALEFYNGLLLEYDCKFVKPYDPEYNYRFFDAFRLDQVMKQVSNDKRVLFVHKLGIFSIIDMYFDLIILSEALNALFKYKKDRVEKNYFYFIFKEVLSNNSSANISDPIKRFEYDSSYGTFKKILDPYINQIIDLSENSITPDEAKETFLTLITGDLRKIEKLIFPFLLDAIILVKELDNPKEYTSTKMEILFDLFSIIKPLNKFYSEKEVMEKEIADGFYNGSFYEYKVHTVRQFMGK